jgi:3-hydroxyacyl-CoA dehydrogenase
VFEVIAERLDWKKDLYKKIESLQIDDLIITSNTSGLSASDLVDGMSDNFKKRFFITHFFNPPRYMKLVEVIKTDFIDDTLISPITSFLEDGLGKGVVYAKDTPNFIANRIGVFGMMNVLNVCKELKLSIEDVDALSGSLIGRPKSGTFRTADIVGLDTMVFVAKTAYDNCTEDECREMFKIPDYIQKMIENNSLGQKSGQGFYKKIEKGVVHSLDLDTMEYTPQNKKRYTGVRFAREHTSTSDRLRVLTYADDIAGEFTWKTISKTLIYSANRLGEISDDIYSIDRAMKWGFGWGMGPFEVWDVLGLSESVSKLKNEGVKVPDSSIVQIQSGTFTPSFFSFETDSDRPNTSQTSNGPMPHPNPHFIALSIL